MVFRIILFLLLCPIHHVLGQLILTDSEKSFTPNSCLQILKSDREIGVHEILALRDSFIKNEDPYPNLGLSKYSVWAKFTIKNSSQANHYLLDVAYPLLDEVELYERDSLEGLISINHFGLLHKFTEREYQHPNYIFNLDITPQQQKEFYLRVSSNEQIILPLSIAKPIGIWERLLRDNIFIGLYLGVVLIMAIYNLFLFFSVRDSSYLHYVIYVVFLGLTQLGMVGFNFQFLWPDSPDWEKISINIFACISSIAVLFFTDSFLNLRKNLPSSRGILAALFFLFIFSIVLTVLNYVQFGFQVMQIATTLESIVLFVVSLFVLKRGFRPAKFFFIAWAVLLIGALIFLLKDYGLLPYNLFTNNSFRLTAIIEMALLSFALGDKINIYRKENEESQARELAVSLENERLVREQNSELERKVEERTRELTASNESLKTTLTDLKETQSQLVEAEKMASLGQLTAGVAHEINNPINFVTSNVAPLRRDIDMIWGAIDTFEKMALNNEISLEDKEKLITEYKDDLDLDYLKVEVEFLLKGMHEGASRTAEIVKSLRVFSRVDENTLKFTNINEGVESTMVILNTLVKDRIEVVKNYGDIPLVECYAGKLNQVFLNIISNAIYAIDKKFPPNSGGVLKIETGLLDDASSIFIKITDNGIGIPEHIKHKIFEPFFTTKDVGEGTGLGMSIAYKTIEMHQGKILIDSEVGVGTTFNVIIPVKQSI